MRVVIIGGGIAAVYLANNLKKQDASLDVIVLSDESHIPYDRIHLCRLLDDFEDTGKISLVLDPTVQLSLNQKIKTIDRVHQRVYSDMDMFSYDKLIIATGSIPISLFDIDDISNASVFRSADDCEIIKKGIENREVVVVGSGPISLEILETLNEMPDVKNITLLVRSKQLYNRHLGIESIKIIEKCYTSASKIRISYEDEIVDKQIENNEITLLETKKLKIENPFLIFGVGIKPNIEYFRETLKSNKGILTNLYMQSEDENIYAVGECAEVEAFGYMAGHVRECTTQADAAISHILQKRVKKFDLEVSIDMLKVGEFELTEVSSPKFTDKYEKIIISSKKDNRIDEYFVDGEQLTRFIGLNSNVDVSYIETLIKKEMKVDINYLYENRLIGQKGRLICSCEHIYHQDLVDIVTKTGIASFKELADYSQAGRVCGRCKIIIDDIIKDSQKLMDPNIIRKSPKELRLEQEIAKVQKRLAKFNSLNPRNELSVKNLESAMESLDIAKSEVNSWVSMVTANMQLHPSFEQEGASGVNNKSTLSILTPLDLSCSSLMRGKNSPLNVGSSWFSALYVVL